MLSVEPINKKWESFGWRVLEVNGHDVSALIETFAEAKNPTGRPTLVIAKTIKGKGISFMENNPDWHGKIMTEVNYRQAMAELRGKI